MSASATKPQFWVPVHLQTSQMDCGPSVLSAVVSGFRLRADLQAIRLACGTDVTGTSLDQLEMVCETIGFDVTQTLEPICPRTFASADLPAITMVKGAGGLAHFVLVWRSVGDWLMVMDPAEGRKWVRRVPFCQTLYRHEMDVAAHEWRDWAENDAFCLPLIAQLKALGLSLSLCNRLLCDAFGDSSWRGAARLDAAARFLTTLRQTCTLIPQAKSERLLVELLRDDALIPEIFWRVGEGHHGTVDMLRLRGSPRVRIAGTQLIGTQSDHLASYRGPTRSNRSQRRPMADLSAITELGGMLFEDGVLRPAVIAATMVVSGVMVVFQMLLFKAMFDLGWALNLGAQRVLVLLGFVTFVSIGAALEWPMVQATQAMGRGIEARMRMALISALPRLSQAFVRSRSIADLAERSHNIYLLRLLPGQALHGIQSLSTLLLTVGAIGFLAPGCLLGALAIGMGAIILPLVFQPCLAAADMKLRSLVASLGQSQMDTLLGLNVIRAHRAERATRLRFDVALSSWKQQSLRQGALSVLITLVQSILTQGLAIGLLALHFFSRPALSGSDLLLVYWVLRLPVIGAELAALVQTYPTQRNILKRIREPIDAATSQACAPTVPPLMKAPAIALEALSITVAGNKILDSIDLKIAPGEHVAIVGSSGAGKSTVMRVLMGLQARTSGDYYIDGELATEAAFTSLRRQTAWVDPAVTIWNQSLDENLVYSTQAGASDRDAAILDMAELKGLVARVPEGLNSQLGEAGRLMSGGEAQRVRFGRALSQESVKLALLDEPFRGMDRQSRLKLLQTARAAWSEATLVCVTHDVKETLDFDRVLVFDGGRILEDGHPAILSQSSSHYAGLLQAETALHAEVWGDRKWRRLWMERGRVFETPAPVNTSERRAVTESPQSGIIRKRYSTIFGGAARHAN